MTKVAAVVGAGPAGLMAAETLCAKGWTVTVYERMPRPARKFLLAGRGGLNLTHSRAWPGFANAYGPDRDTQLGQALADFKPDDLIRWCHGLGVETFIGSSGRVFPKQMKASPLLRAWLRRLADTGVALRSRHICTGIAVSHSPDIPRQIVLRFQSADHPEPIPAAFDAVVLALGGASWPQLGSTGDWTAWLAHQGVPIKQWQPSNCGVCTPWSSHLTTRFSGSPLKRVAVTCQGERVLGDLVITHTGLEGGPVYALAKPIREGLNVNGGQPVTIRLDLRPDLDHDNLAARLSRPRRKQSMSTFLRKSAQLSVPAIALLHEASNGPLDNDPAVLSRRIKNLALPITGLAGLDKAISSVGGIPLHAIDHMFMLKALPGVFAAGEMLDWDAPTGGYLLQASFATGRAAGIGADTWFAAQHQSNRSPSQPISAD